MVQSGDGHSPVAAEPRVQPGVIQTVLLDEIVASIEKLHDLMAEMVPQGRVYPIECTVGTTIRGEPFRTKIFSITITNDGPEDVRFSVNARTGPYGLIRSGETLPLNMGRGKIKGLYFYTESGEAALRIYGVY